MMGVAIANVGSKTIVVAIYFSKGNIIGEFINNVSPPEKIN